MIDSLFSYLDSCVCRTLVRTSCTHICTHICLSPYFQSFWVDRYSELNCWIIHGNSLFKFLRNSTLFSMTAALIYIPISSAQGVWFLKWYLIVILMCFPNNQWCWTYVHVLLVFTILLVFDNIIVSVYPSKCLLWHFSFFFPRVSSESVQNYVWNTLYFPPSVIINRSRLAAKVHTHPVSAVFRDDFHHPKLFSLGKPRSLEC